MLRFIEFSEDSYQPPDNKEVCLFPWLGLHEAVFALTGWPKKGLVYAKIHGLPENIEKDRPWLFFSPVKKFDPRDYGKPYERVYKELKLSIECGGVQAKFVPLFNGVHFLVKPRDVLFWALCRGMSLPGDWQEMFNVYLFKPEGKSSALQRKIINKIVAQFVLLQKPTALLKEIIDSDLMQNFGSVHDAKVSRFKTIENHINELIRSGRECTREPIPEILRKGPNGNNYHMPSLIRGMVTAGMIKSYQKMEKGDLYNSLEDFLADFFDDPIVILYLKDAPEIIKNVVITRVAYSGPSEQ